MKSLYFRFAVGALVVAILAVVLPGWMMRMQDRPDGQQGIRMLSEQSAALQIAERLNGLSGEELKRVLDSLRTTTESHIRLDPIPFRFQLPPDSLNQSLVVFEPKRRPDRQGIGILLPDASALLRVNSPDGLPKEIQTLLLYHVAIVLTIAGLVAFVVVAPVVRRLRRLESAAIAFGNGQLRARAGIKSADAVGLVAKRFDAMAERIETMIGRERSLLHAVSHELRTPIARLRFSLEMLEQESDPSERARRMNQIDDELTEIDQLVGELLDYNRLNAEAIQLDRQVHALLPIIQEVVERTGELGPSVAVSIVSDSPTELLVPVDRLLFRRVITNLLTNAMRFASTQIEVKLARMQGQICIEVSDDGPGIPETERSNVLKPFYRLTPTKDSHAGGAGLGLAIVSRIVALHGGSLTIDSSQSGGALIRTNWPTTVSAI